MINRLYAFLAIVFWSLPFLTGSTIATESDGSVGTALEILERDCLACHGVARQGGLI